MIGIGIEELGGAANHARYTGVATMVVADRDAAIEAVGDLLAYLPDHVDAEPPVVATDDPADRRCPEAGELIPPTSTGSYDVRKVAAAIVDDDSLLELKAQWAANVVTAFATIAGAPVGIVANQPITLAGTLDIPASQKAARFVAHVRRLQPADRHPGRHARLLPRQGPRVARHDPPRRPARLRLCPRDRATHLRDPAQELRRRLHRHGLQDDGQRSVPGLAVGRAGRDGCRPGRSDPAAARDARGTRRVRTRLRANGCSTRMSPPSVGSSTP